MVSNITLANLVPAKLAGKWFDNHYRYFESNGAMKTGWIKDKGVWYYLNPEDGIMLVGLHKVNGDHYYFDESGAMQTGWKTA